MTDKMSYFSLTTAPVEILSLNNKSCGQATAFFYKANNLNTYLITNWHVVTGRDTSKPNFSKSGAVPLTLRCTLHSKTDDMETI